VVDQHIQRIELLLN